eukprot:8975557-Pyramimonas_sp.AAC.1
MAERAPRPLRSSPMESFARGRDSDQVAEVRHQVGGGTMGRRWLTQNRLCEVEPHPPVLLGNDGGHDQTSGDVAQYLAKGYNNREYEGDAEMSIVPYVCKYVGLHVRTYIHAISWFLCIQGGRPYII